MDRPPLHFRLLESLQGIGSRLIDAREWLAERWDRVFGGVFEGVMDAFDSFDSLEAAIVTVVRVVFWPLTALVKLLRIDRLVVWLFQLPGRIGWAVFTALMATAERLHLGGAFQRLADFTWWLTTPVRGVGSFVHAWCVTRRPRDLALATPAVLMLLPFVYVAIAGSVQSQGAIADRYRDAVRDAEEEHDLELADLMRRKLEQLGVSTHRTDYIAACRIDEQGDAADAYARMKKIAPLDAGGFAPAHHWIIVKLLANELDETIEPALADPDQRLELAQQHLARLTELAGDSEALASTRAYILADRGDLDNAIAAISPYTESSFRAAALRLRLLFKGEQLNAAQAHAPGVLRLFEDSPPRSPTADDHRSCALAASLTGDPARLEQALLELAPLVPEDAGVQRQLAAVSLQIAERALGSDFFDPDAVALRIVRAARLGAPPQQVASLVTRIVQRRRESDPCREAWNAILSATDAPTQLIQNAGAIAAAAGEITQARKAFRQITDAGDAPAVVWNNLAWTLLQEPMPQHAEALEAVNRALAVEPNNARYRETRGQAYVRLKQWRNAIVDLEHALNAMPDSADAHASLAKAYESVGEYQLAEVHRQHGE